MSDKKNPKGVQPTRPKDGEFGTRGSGGGSAKPPKNPPPASGKKG